MQAKVLLTGSSGYVGGRLLRKLLQQNQQIRCLSRRKVEGSDDGNCEFCVGDALNQASLEVALEGIETAYYLVHSMGSKDDFEETDRLAAENFARACSNKGVKRIIYLGGLGNDDEHLSKHLRSRQEVGRILRESGCQVIEFRASIIIGSGSLSFEMIRALVERLPVMVCPKWVRVLAQPIAIEDVIQYLIDAQDIELDESRVFEIGGPDQMSYGDIMHKYAAQRGLRRWMIPVPFLTPYLSSLWLGLVTPLYSRVGRKLVDSLKNETLVADDSAKKYFNIVPRSTDESISRALANEDQEFAETRWSDAFSSGSKPNSWGGVRFGSRLVDSRVRTVKASPAEAFAPIQRIGGRKGWYYGNWLWKIRGFLDLLVGGVGTRRGRRHPKKLRVGDALDFWRVEKIEESKILRLSAEMKVPGRAWLEFEVTKNENNETEIRQTAIFDPIGLFGIVYWYSLFPLHQFVFGGMLRNICRSAESEYVNSSSRLVSDSNTKQPEFATKE